MSSFDPNRYGAAGGLPDPLFDDYRAGSAGAWSRSPASYQTSEPVHLIEDDAADAEAIALMLSERGFIVRRWSSLGALLDRQPALESGCVVADLIGPRSMCPEVNRFLSEHIGTIPTIVVTRHGTIGDAVALMRRGAVDVLEHPVEASALLTAIERAGAMLRQRRAIAAATATARATIATLSPRERNVLDALIGGASNKVIAERLGISPRTVEIHRARVMTKLDAASLAQVMRLAFAAGIA